MKRRRIKFFIIIFIVILIGIIFGKRLIKKDTEIIEVEVSPVKRGEITEVISCKGKIASSNLQKIKLNIDGTVENIYVKEGMEVKKGQVLCTIRNPDEQELFSIKQSLRSSIMDCEVAKEKLQEAKKTYDRNMENALLDLEDARENLEKYKKLYEEKAISKRQLIDAEKTLKKAHLRYEEAKGNPIVRDAEIQVKKARLELENVKKRLKSFIEKIRPRDRRVLPSDIESLKRILHKIYSPLDMAEVISSIDGTIVKVDVRKGERVKKEAQRDAHFKIADLKNPIVELEVSEYDIKRIKIGQKIKIISHSFSKVLTGHVTRISEEIKEIKEGQEGKSFILVKGEIDNLKGAKLKLGSSVEAEIVVSHLSSVLKVPIESVLDSEGGKVVYVVEDNIARIRPVEIGICGKKELEIKNGLKEGEMVITIGNLDVKDGVRVRIVNKKGRFYEDNRDY